MHGATLTEDSKLAIGVNVSVNGCLCLLGLQQAGDHPECALHLKL